MILVTLVCCFAACWRPTKTQGVADVSQHLCDNDMDPGYANILPHAQHNVFAVSATMPFVVNSEDLWGGAGRNPREYYFWFFGYVAKLPYKQSEVLYPAFCHSHHDPSVVS